MLYIGGRGLATIDRLLTVSLFVEKLYIYIIRAQLSTYYVYNTCSYNTCPMYNIYIGQKLAEEEPLGLKYTANLPVGVMNTVRRMYGAY